MSRYAEVDALIDRLDYCVKEGMGSTIAFTFKHMVEDAPSIDIVRCKECMHWDRAIDENGIERFNFSKCVKGHYGNGFDFYCTDGERECE